MGMHKKLRFLGNTWIHTSVFSNYSEPLCTGSSTIYHSQQTFKIETMLFRLHICASLIIQEIVIFKHQSFPRFWNWHCLSMDTNCTRMF